MPDEYISREAMLEHLDRCKQSEDATTLTAAVITELQCFVKSQPAAVEVGTQAALCAV